MKSQEEIITIEIKQYSAFDLMPKWAQWSLVVLMGSLIIILGTLIYITKP